MTCRSRQVSKHRHGPRFKYAARAAVCVCALLLSGIGQHASAQSAGFALPDIPVLTIEPSRLFADTQFGQRLSKEIETRGSQIAAENRRIEKELADEESDLIVKRTTMEAVAFRELADAFDIKVTTARAAQDDKARALAALSDQAQRAFLQSIAPILEEMMNENGASVILDRRAVFLSADASDITASAIARIDEELEDGAALSELLSDGAGQATEPEQ